MSPKNNIACGRSDLAACQLLRRLWLIMYVLNQVREGSQPWKGRGTWVSAIIRIRELSAVVSPGQRHQAMLQTKVPYSHHQIATVQYTFKTWTGVILALIRRNLKNWGFKVIASSKDTPSPLIKWLRERKGRSWIDNWKDRAWTCHCPCPCPWDGLNWFRKLYLGIVDAENHCASQSHSFHVPFKENKNYNISICELSNDQSKLRRTPAPSTRMQGPPRMILSPRPASSMYCFTSSSSAPGWSHSAGIPSSVASFKTLKVTLTVTRLIGDRRCYVRPDAHGGGVIMDTEVVLGEGNSDIDFNVFRPSSSASFCTSLSDGTSPIYQIWSLTGWIGVTFLSWVWYHFRTLIHVMHQTL